ncbi:hypothetical protein E2C01_081321 [Portunus trituberculatus]|uniref:Uncharacterized protein n=1 Tax=Portunus trituberculatus TaxID=210409 RepID=A0A5B7ILX8_PORTR|nr:hypothetical protein [Portunus trituberculatus]
MITILNVIAAILTSTRSRYSWKALLTADSQRSLVSVDELPSKDSLTYESLGANIERLEEVR